MDKDNLYETINNDDNMTDQEKRDLYSAEIANNEAREQWEKNGRT